jgi:hypothetical protein
MMEAVNTSETSVNFYQTTRRNVPEDSHLRVVFCLNYYIGPIVYTCVGFKGLSRVKTCLQCRMDSSGCTWYVFVFQGTPSLTLYISGSYLHPLNRQEDAAGPDASYLCAANTVPVRGNLSYIPTLVKPECRAGMLQIFRICKLRSLSSNVLKGNGRDVVVVSGLGPKTACPGCGFEWLCSDCQSTLTQPAQHVMSFLVRSFETNEADKASLNKLKTIWL